MRRALVAFAWCCIPLACGAAQFVGVVSHVTDGDTVWVRPVSGGPPQQVRIDGIDAPEICQPYGTEARAALSARILNRRVTVAPRREDQWRRIVARVKVGRDDVGGWMVAHGHAWSYRFRRDLGPYARVEARARAAQVGLWRTGAAETPRDFRVRHGSCH